MDFYKFDKRKVGVGAYGSVCKVKNTSSGKVRACKTMSKAQMKTVERCKQEIAILQLMDHPNIVKLFETYEDSRCVYLIMELCVGGELFESIISSDHFGEKDAAVLMKQIIRGLYYMHQLHVCHRDLKPENFLFLQKGHVKDTTLKIIDFGLSCFFEEGQYLVTRAGTPYYIAPQVLIGRYTQASDLWSIGVIMYVLLCGYTPFHGETDAAVLAKVQVGSYQFHPSDWRGISEDAKNLISRLLAIDPTVRATAADALNHVWIAKLAPNSTGNELSQTIVTNLKNFQLENKLKNAALQTIAGNMNEKQISKLRDVFTTLDANGDGLLTLAELRSGIHKSGVPITLNLQELMEQVDSDGSGVIDYTEFIAATLDVKTYSQEDACWVAFQLFDRAGNGQISMEELKCSLRSSELEDMDAQMLQDIMNEIDTDRDGEISFDEFLAMMRSGGGDIVDRVIRTTSITITSDE